MDATSNLAELAPFSALVFGAIALGGGIYETLLIDRVWPKKPSLVQPSRGGINRGLFWAPVHMLYEFALLVAIWLTWNHSVVRWWIIAALLIHLAARTWSFVYFIPNALRFEKMGDLTDEQRLLAQTWTRLSRCRPVLLMLSLAGLCLALSHLVAAEITR